MNQQILLSLNNEASLPQGKWGSNKSQKTIVDSEAEAAMAELLKLLEDKFCAQLRN